MKAKKTMAKVKRIDGLPRTASAARGRGHKKVDVNFDEMSDREKSKWTTIASRGVAHGDIGRVGPASGGGKIVCYYDENTGNYDICHVVP